MSATEAPPPPLAVAVVVSAEHGGRSVPARWRPLFAGREALLASHRGWDPGAAALARRLACCLGAPCLVARTTRLLVDLNRSPGHPRIFSEVTRTLPAAERRRILEEHHTPHRARVTAAVAAGIEHAGAAVHVAVHSFTPVLDGRVREADVGILYDPARAGERALAAAWGRALRSRVPELVVRMNAPYRGVSDGLPTALRRRWDARRYLGIELEVNQRHLGPDGCFPATLADALARSLRDALEGFRP